MFIRINIIGNTKMIILTGSENISFEVYIVNIISTSPIKIENKILDNQCLWCNNPLIEYSITLCIISINPTATGLFARILFLTLFLLVKEFL